MLTKAQIQFTEKQIDQLDELRRQTGAIRTELIHRAVDYYIRRIPEHGFQKGLFTLLTSETKEAR